jgi:hypothetical protein
MVRTFAEQSPERKGKKVETLGTATIAGEPRALASRPIPANKAK